MRFATVTDPRHAPGEWKPYAIGAGATLLLFAAIAAVYFYSIVPRVWVSPEPAPSSPAAQTAPALSPDEVAALESALAKNADDLAARGKLVESYSTGFHPAELRPHMLWMIRTHPEGIMVDGKRFNPLIDPSFDPEGYAEGRKLWLARLVRHNVPDQELRNGAAYFRPGDHVIAQKLLLRAEYHDDAVANQFGEEYYAHLADGPAWHWAQPYGDSGGQAISVRVTVQPGKK